MRHIRVLICRVDDPDADQITEPAAFDLPTATRTALPPAPALDALETTTRATGNASLRRVLHAHWDPLAAQLTEQSRQRFSPRPRPRRRPCAAHRGAPLRHLGSHASPVPAAGQAAPRHARHPPMATTPRQP